MTDSSKLEIGISGEFEREYQRQISLAKRSEQGVPNAPEVQPQREVTNVEFREAIRMLSQAVTNQAGIHEFLRMNPPSFTGSSTTEDPENFIEELKKDLV
ncbi:hypothetical protein H5410_000968 [Solanum commersonii]|uniref:Gag-pol polyprotein n=1 Tax=Solanum commersonii TaxID=4109 RepID=A0A9J6AYE4_SOLCO|nr:hypothetical protein H5410_000968 [Solanum commersonii]